MKTHEKTFQTVKWAVFFIWLVTMASMLFGCASRAELLREHTTRMAAIMEIEPVPGMIFGKLPRYALGLGKTCGYIAMTRDWSGVWIAYDDRSWECRLMSTHRLVLHELCHAKYAHVYSTMTKAEKEREAEECVRFYWSQ